MKFISIVLFLVGVSIHCSIVQNGNFEAPAEVFRKFLTNSQSKMCIEAAKSRLDHLHPRSNPNVLFNRLQRYLLGCSASDYRASPLCIPGEQGSLLYQIKVASRQEVITFTLSSDSPNVLMIDYCCDGNEEVTKIKVNCGNPDKLSS